MFIFCVSFSITVWRAQSAVGVMIDPSIDQSKTNQRCMGKRRSLGFCPLVNNVSIALPTENAAVVVVVLP